MSSYNENFNSKLDWAMPFQRTGKYPLDRTDLFDSLEDAQKYALGDGSDSRGLGKSSYIGQIITVYEDDIVQVYKIDPDRTISQISDPEVLSNYAEKSEIPTKLSQLENDANYTTTEILNQAVQAVNSNINSVNQSINTRLQTVSEKANKADTTATDALNLAEGIQGNLSSFALKSDLKNYITTTDAHEYTDTAIANLVDSAPETLNTLNELATAITEYQNVTDALDAAISNKVDKSELPIITSHIESLEDSVTELESQIGDINTILESIING